MKIKQRILAWLGIEEIISLKLESQADWFRAHLEAHQVAFDKALALQKAEFDSRVGAILDASMTASEKIAKLVAERGDNNLKSYVDSCFQTFQEVAIGQMN